jgi:predicted ATPase/DNA-binding winged helix-turn-helix (wHTH) protein
MSVAFVFGPFCLYPGIRVLRKEGVEVALGSRAFDLLTALVASQGKVMTQRELTAAAWPGLVVADSNVRVQIANVRQALGCGVGDVRYIASVAGRGYCLVAKVEQVDGSEPLQAPAPQPATAHRLLAHIPAPPGAAIGREKNVAELLKLISGWPLVTVVGAGGAGKTTLAVLVAHAVDGFGEAIFFVDLSTVDDPGRVLEALALAVGYRPSGADLLSELLEVLSIKRTLIVLDNCEHVLAAVADLCRRIRLSAPGVSFLATSREALRIKDETVYLLQPLAFPAEGEHLGARQAMTWPAIRLFVERAKESGASKSLGDDEAPVVAELCRRLDGNPHAIGLVASRVGTYGIQGVANLLDKQFALHWQGRRDDAPRHQTVEAMIDWSHHLLRPKDQETLHRLSVFCGGFSLEAAVAVAANDQIDAFAVEEAIRDLVDKSLVAVHSVGDETRFRLLETTRAFAAARLVKQRRQNKIALRHALYYAQQLRDYADGQSATAIGRPIPMPSMDNVRAALEWSFSSGRDPALATEMSSLAAPVFLELGLLLECKRWCERALESLPDQHRTTALELGLLESLAIAYYSGGEYDGPLLPVVERGLALARRLEISHLTFHFLAAQHLALIALGRMPASLEVSEHYGAAAGDQGGPGEAVIARWMEGASWHFSGNQLAAEEHYLAAAELLAAQAMRPLRYFEDKQQTLATLGRARVMWLRGMPAQALQLANSAINASRAHPDSFCLCGTLCFAIVLANAAFDQAEELARELENVAQDYKVAVRHQVVHFLKGLLVLHQKDFPAAVGHLQLCLATLPPPTLSFLRTDALQALAEARRECGDHSGALAAISEAIDLAQQTGGLFSFPDLLKTRAEVLLALDPGEQATAADVLTQAMDCAREQGALSWELGVALVMYRTGASPDSCEAAKEVLSGVFFRFTEGLETRDLKAAAQALLNI